MEEPMKLAFLHNICIIWSNKFIFLELSSLILICYIGIIVNVIPLLLLAHTYCRQEEYVLFFQLLSLIPLLGLLLPLPLIVPLAKFVIPALWSLKVRHQAQSFCLTPYLLLCFQSFFVDFVIESQLNLHIVWTPSSLSALTPIFFPAKEISARNSVFFRNFFGLNSFHELYKKMITCLTAYYFSATVYFL